MTDQIRIISTGWLSRVGMTAAVVVEITSGPTIAVGAHVVMAGPDGAVCHSLLSILPAHLDLYKRVCQAAIDSVVELDRLEAAPC